MGACGTCRDGRLRFPVRLSECTSALLRGLRRASVLRRVGPEELVDGFAKGAPWGRAVGTDEVRARKDAGHHRCVLRVTNGGRINERANASSEVFEVYEHR